MAFGTVSAEEAIWDSWAAEYDEIVNSDPGAADVGPCVGFLRGLCRDTALELGVGTGRVAIPLSRRGVAVCGVDISRLMLDRLGARDPDRLVETVHGDMASISGLGEFDLVYAVYSTLFVLPTQEEQLRCLAAAAQHLRPGGALVIDAFVPDLARFNRGQAIDVRAITQDRVVLDISTHDGPGQRLKGAYLDIRGGQAHHHLVRVRYAWPSEIDLMARLAGLRLVERFGSWTGQAFDDRSSRHISVYRTMLPTKEEP